MSANVQINMNSLSTKLLLGTQYSPDDIYIAVMGMTGSGKSTFITKLCGDVVKVGENLTSCTQEVQIFSYKHLDSTVHLIDTPGFDDSFRSDEDVLEDLASWLRGAYLKNTLLNGIIYLHPINHNRMTGTARKNIRMFHKLCGESNLRNVVLATTMWSEVSEAKGMERQKELKSSFWEGMFKQGSHITRHSNDRTSAMNIINYILDQNMRRVLQIQQEMADGKTRLDQTSAGQELGKEILEQRKRFAKELEDAQTKMKEALAQQSQENADAAARQQERFAKKLEELEKRDEQSKKTIEEVMRQKEEKFRQMARDLEAAKCRKAGQTREWEEEVASLKAELKRKDEYHKLCQEQGEEESKQIRDQLESNQSIMKQMMEQRVPSPAPPPYTPSTYQMESSDSGLSVTAGTTGGVVGIMLAAGAMAACVVM